MIFGVASFTDAWIETCHTKQQWPKQLSRPSRTRGLKPVNDHLGCVNLWSRPSRTRGLKLDVNNALRTNSDVASFTDAWIETIPADHIFLTEDVASFTDAWIETDNHTE